MGWKQASFLPHSQETKLFILIWWLFILDIVEKLLFRLSIDLKSGVNFYHFHRTVENLSEHFNQEDIFNCL